LVITENEEKGRILETVLRICLISYNDSLDIKRLRIDIMVIGLICILKGMMAVNNQD